MLEDDRGHCLAYPAIGPSPPGGPRSAERKLLALCSGTKWRDLPEGYGPWKTVHDRFRQWREDGTFEAALDRLLDERREPD
ncbi:transposase [Halomonas nitroreducens]|uniref:Transposase n=1 Tax=Halomonas nitroreducens TaxID=447425 RepID=A0A431V2A1_9GAMM|nr:transposase [Halomonas nitroreducens]